MVVSNELDIDGLVGTAELCFNLAVDIKKELGITVEFIDLGGGVGVAYKPEQTPVDFRVLSKGVEEAYNRILVANGLNDVALAYECGRMVTGPFGYLVSTAIHKKDIYRHYIGLDACMANLMRPALYGSYHHITVMGKENAPKDHVYDVTGSLCENNDKFAIQRELPKLILEIVSSFTMLVHMDILWVSIIMVNYVLQSYCYIKMALLHKFVVLKHMMIYLELLIFQIYNLILRIE